LKRDADAACPPQPKRAKKRKAKAAKPKTCGCCHCHQRFAPEQMAVRNGSRVKVCQPCEDKALERKRVEKLARKEARKLDAEAKTQRRRLQWSAQVARYRTKHPERHLARELARRAVRQGKIKPRKRCQALGCRQPTAHRHHNSYDTPLLVAHLCLKHHEAVHHIGAVKLRKSAAFPFAMAPAAAWGSNPKVTPRVQH
jgi:hypothetical protein